MSNEASDSGWRPLRKPAPSASTEEVRRALVVTPFVRFARVHGIFAAADGLIAVALAGSIFFSIDPSAARWRVALYLVLTIAPFAVVTPLIGPAIDRARSGRRGMIVATGLARAVIAFLMIQHIESILLFPEAFALLVMQKSYSVAKSAVVPKIVRSHTDLVDGNARLALLSAISGMSGAAVGALFSLGGPQWVAGVAMLAYVAGSIASFQLPAVVVADSTDPAVERAELRGRGILYAATAMGFLRLVVGFVTFLMAFSFRGGVDGVDIDAKGAAVGAATAVVRDVDIAGSPSAPAWHFGVVLVGAGLGTLIGARSAPALRRRVPEERIIQSGLLITATAGLIGAWISGVWGSFVVALAVSVSASAAKLAFDALVQRDAPDISQGRAFARFEARFQLMWVGGALLAVVPFGLTVGLTIVAIVGGLAFVSYTLAQLGYESPWERAGVADGIKRRLPKALGRRIVAAPDEDTDPTWVGGFPPLVDPTIEVPITASSDPEEDEQLEGDHLERDEQAPSAPPAPTTPISDPFQPWISTGEGVEVDRPSP